MREIQTEIEINSSPERIWQLLTDFDQYPRWNPFIRSISGRLEPNSKLEVRIQPSGARGMNFRPVLLIAEPNRELRWRGRLLIPGVFYGEHIFQIEQLASDRVRFLHQEKFSGMLVPLVWRSVGADTRRGFVEMNEALKKRAESSK